MMSGRNGVGSTEAALTTASERTARHGYPHPYHARFPLPQYLRRAARRRRRQAATAELDALKAEARSRGVELLVGDHHEVTVTEQIAGRLDTAAVKAHLGDTYSRFEKAVISTVVRIKAVDRLAIAA